jgi:hypothetical protein
MPYSLQWNFSVERGLTRDTTLEVGYVGNHAVHQTSSIDVNQVLPENRVLGAFRDDNSNRNALRPFPNFGQLLYWQHRGDATYHSLQTLFRTKIKRSELQLAYTWSHSIGNVELDNSSGGMSQGAFIDPNNPALDRGNTTINRPHTFVANAVFFLPALAGANGFVKNTFGGWEYTVISSLASGNSITVYQQGVSDVNGGTLNDIFGAGYNGSHRPDLTGESCTSGRHGYQMLNPGAFTLVGHHIGELGTAPRGYCHGPALVNSDMALYKNWELPFVGNERMRIQFRIEAFNVFNTANFRGDNVNAYGPVSKVACGNTPCSPTNNVVTSETRNDTFGQATRTRGPREIQYGLKFVF